MPTSPGRPNRPNAAHVRIPRAMQWGPLPGGARDLWVLLDDVCREYASVHLTVSQLATTLHCSTSAVQKWRRALVADGWLAFTAAEHRGQVSLWEPLGRPRQVTHRRPVPVDNSAGRVDGRVESCPPSDLGKGGRASTLDAGATRARPQEHQRVIDLRAVDDERARVAALAGRPSSWPAWCGSCEPRTSQAESLLSPGLPTRCPSCHPSRPVPVF